METLIALFKSKYRVMRVENVYFVQSKNGILPWKNRYISTNEDFAMYHYRLLIGNKEILVESV